MSVLTLFSPLLSQAKDKYYDIYLTNARVCKKCKGRWIDSYRVELYNKKGESAIYEHSEIVGVDNHPFWRKFLIESVKNQGKAGEVIVTPYYDPTNPRKDDYSQIGQ